jgi:hypothetical protein
MHSSKTFACRSPLVSSVTMRPRASVAGIAGGLHDALDACLNLKAPPSSRVDEYQEGRSFPHPCIARIPLACALLLPLLIALLLFPLLGTSWLPVLPLCLIHLLLVPGGLVRV